MSFSLPLSSFPSTRPLRIITVHLWSRDCIFPLQIPREKQKQRSDFCTQEHHASRDPRGSLRGDAGIWGGEEWRVGFGESGGDTALFGALFKSREVPPLAPSNLTCHPPNPVTLQTGRNWTLPPDWTAKGPFPRLNFTCGSSHSCSAQHRTAHLVDACLQHSDLIQIAHISPFSLSSTSCHNSPCLVSMASSLWPR